MIFKGWHSVAALSVALAPLAAADICSKLDTENIQVNKHLSLDYTSELHRYWSTACGDLKPSCIVFPSSAQEVSTVINELHHVDDLFAVKSGGHMPNNGFASIADGVLIATRNLNQVVYHPEDQTADIGPGLSWEEAHEGLKGTGRTIVGGRLGGVGIGGYMLGGGLSFLSSQYGWAANNVVDFEVVLANGTIVHANAKENTDLFGALKGGGNNFGIVTNYRLQTHPQDHKVWGGNYVFTSDKTPEVLDAVMEFTTNYPDDKAAVIVTSDYGALIDTWIMFLFYDGPEPPEHVFKKFKDIGPIDTTKTWDSYYDLLKNNDIFILQGQRYIIGTETTPLPEYNGSAGVLQSYYDHWHDSSKDVLDVAGVIASIAFQPMPRAITKKAKERGGDLLDFDTEHDYIIFELDFSHGLSPGDNRIDAALQNVYKGLDKRISEFIQNGTIPDVHRPLFMNDAYYREDYWGRISDSKRQEALEARKKYDPDMFWQKRTSGGFRLG